MPLTNRDQGVFPARLARWTGFLLYRAHVRAHAAFQDALAPLGLTPKTFGALTVIAEDGPMSQAALGETMVIDRTTMVALVDELERAGYVERGRNNTDRRAHSLQATDAGKAVLRAAERVAQRQQDELLADLNSDEREQFAALLARIAG